MNHFQRHGIYRRRTTFAILCGFVFVSVCETRADAAAPNPPVVGPKQAPLAATAAELTRAAFDAAVAGNDRERQRLLEEALTIDPNYAPAHWLAGETLLGDCWIQADDSRAAASQTTSLAGYRARRGRTGESVAEQLDLAKWCLANGYPEQARSHFTRVLVQQPMHAEAIAKLGLKRHNDRLLTQPQIDQERDKAARAAEELAHWQPILAELRKKMEHGSPTSRQVAKSELAAIYQPEAIAAIEEAIAKASPSTGLEMIAALQRIKCQSSTEALARQAVLASAPRVREAATTALGGRALNNYVPALLSGLASPVETNVDIDFDAAGLTLRQSTLQEGKRTDRLDNTEFHLGLRQPNPYFGFFIANTMSRAAGVVAAKTEEGQEANSAALVRNERIMKTLRSATGENAGATPRDWWDWWHSYNDIFQGVDRPILGSTTRYDCNVPYCRPPSNTPIVFIYGLCSCFAKGTPVWTSSGVAPIETIQVGDLVLAQNIETGELAYKPVLETSLRPVRPMLNLDFDGEIITSTRGHLFWIVGEGWQMAKALKPGDRVHGAPQDAYLGRSQETKPADAYNLIVADFDTYFVGQHRLLVHDNTERKSGDGKLPGMSP